MAARMTMIFRSQRCFSLWITVTWVIPILFSASDVFGHRSSIEVTLTPSCHSTQTSPELFASMDYTVTCDENALGFDEIRGFIRSTGTKEPEFIVDLYKYQESTEISLGKVSHPEWVSFKMVIPMHQNHCQLHFISAQIRCQSTDLDSNTSEKQKLAQVAIENAPFLNLRGDQYREDEITDTPLLLTYSILPGDPRLGTKKLQYTLFFSDEDAQQTPESVQAQVARYGRTTDIEWIYQIELDRDFKILSKTYQGRLHSQQHFYGEYLANSAHPILYNATLNNTFSDRPICNAQREHLRGHLLIPRRRLKHSLAREWAMFQEPWTFNVSWAEMLRTRRASDAVKPENQLFVFANRKFYQGRLDRAIEFSQTEALRNMPILFPNSFLKRLGDDLWHSIQTWYGEAYASIPIGAENLDAIAQKELMAIFRTRERDWLQSPQPKVIRFYRLQPHPKTELFQVQELENIQNLLH